MIRFYMDEQFHGSITDELVRRGVDCLTVQQDGRSGAADVLILERATQLGRVLLSSDDDMLRHAAECVSSGRSFPGLVYVHTLRVSVGRAVIDLDFIARASEPADLVNQVWYLPL